MKFVDDDDDDDGEVCSFFSANVNMASDDKFSWLLAQSNIDQR